MANNDYSYDDVKNGTGQYCKELSPTYSSGVCTMQTRLRAIGYDIIADGKFDSVTENVVKNFQKECMMNNDGVAGKQTLIQLDKVYQSSYFTSCGKYLTSAQWGENNIKAGLFNNVDLLARIIWAEDESNESAQYGVAQVIKNRSNNSAFYIPESEAPNASLWARVIAKPGEYATAEGTARSRKPERGKYTESDGINPRWKSAVNIANYLVNGPAFVPPMGYRVNISNINNPYVDTSTQLWVTSQYHQTSSDSFRRNLAANAVDASIPVVTYRSTLTGNVFYTMPY